MVVELLDPSAPCSTSSTSRLTPSWWEGLAPAACAPRTATGCSSGRPRQAWVRWTGLADPTDVLRQVVAPLLARDDVRP
jgi:hypothetical protein